MWRSYIDEYVLCKYGIKTDMKIRYWWICIMQIWHKNWYEDRILMNMYYANMALKLILRFDFDKYSYKLYSTVC